MRKIGSFLFLSLCLCGITVARETPKAVKKARRAVISIITYDAQGNMLRNGNGLFIDAAGTALADYTLFKGAASAVTVDADGVRRPVKRILGADEMYDGIKFNVRPDKKLVYLPLVQTPPAEGSTLYLLPCSTQNPEEYIPVLFTQVDKISGGSYYTLRLASGNKQVSCPIVTASGEAVGLLQRSSVANDTLSYAIGTDYLAGLKIGALSHSDEALGKILLRKAVPEKLEDATVYLFMKSRQNDKEDYLNTVNDFIEQFPANDEGYLQRAACYAGQYSDSSNIEKAEADWEKALTLTSSPDNVHYQHAKLMYAVCAGDTTFAYSRWSLPVALELTQRAYSLNPLPIYLQQEGNLRYILKDYSGAYDCFYRLKETNLSSPDNYYSAAKSLEMAHGADTAIALMDSAVALFPIPMGKEAAPYILTRGLMKERADRYREAVMDYYQYEKLVSPNLGASFYYLREQAEYKAKMYQQALDDINRALELAPDNGEYQMAKGTLCYRIGYTDEAIDALKHVTQLLPDYADGYYLLGLCCIQKNEKETACTHFAKAKALEYAHADEAIEKYCK